MREPDLIADCPSCGHRFQAVKGVMRQPCPSCHTALILTRYPKGDPRAHIPSPAQNAIAVIGGIAIGVTLLMVVLAVFGVLLGVL